MLTTIAKYIMYELQASAPMTGLEIQAGLKGQKIVLKLQAIELEIERLIELEIVEYSNFGGFGVDIDDEDFELAYQTSSSWDAMPLEQQKELLSLQEKYNG